MTRRRARLLRSTAEIVTNSAQIVGYDASLGGAASDLMRVSNTIYTGILLQIRC
jgi:hypothetical protein